MVFGARVIQNARSDQKERKIKIEIVCVRVEEASIRRRGWGRKNKHNWLTKYGTPDDSFSI